MCVSDQDMFSQMQDPLSAADKSTAYHRIARSRQGPFQGLQGNVQTCYGFMQAGSTPSLFLFRFWQHMFHPCISSPQASVDSLRCRRHAYEDYVKVIKNHATQPLRGSGSPVTSAPNESKCHQQEVRGPVSAVHPLRAS